MLRIDDRDGVRLLTLDRPEARNAFNRVLYDLCADALEDAAADPAISVVVITGTGPAFSAGQDLGEMGQIQPASTTSDPSGFPRFIDAVIDFPKPLVAAVNGVAVGVGMTMLAYCDLVLVAEGARLRAPFASLGVVPEAASSVTFPRIMGWQAAAHALLTAAWVSAEDAVTSGLAWRMVPADELLDAAVAVAGDIAAMPVSSLVETKRLMKAPLLAGIRQARAAEDEAFGRVLNSPANREAIAAFLEKRPADFRNLPPE